MKQGWEIQKLADVILDIKDGGTPSRTRPEYFGGNIKWCVVKDVLPEIYETKEKLTELGLSKCSAKVWPVNSVIISLGATIGQVGIAKVPVATKQGISGILVNPKLIIPEFLVYYLNFKKEYIQGIATGATIKEVRPTKLATMLILHLPTLPDQQLIVAILDEAFASIAKAKANAEQNLKNAKELFESYLQSVFANKGKTWEEKQLGEIAYVKSGGTPSRAKKEYWGGIVPWYSSGELNELYTKEPMRYINNLAIENSNAKLFPKGSLLIGMYDTAALKMSILDREGTFNQAVAGVKPNNKIDLIFVLYSINSNKPEILNLRRGVRQKNLSLAKIKDIPIYLPPLPHQKYIVQKLDALSSEIKKLEIVYKEKLNNLEELKRSILQKAFSGELKTT